MPRAPTLRSEACVKREVKKLLTAAGWFWWMPPANGYGKAGIADFNALKQGDFLAIETKYGDNKPTPAQLRYLQQVWAHGGVGFVVDESRLGPLSWWLEGRDIGPAVAAMAREVAALVAAEERR